MAGVDDIESHVAEDERNYENRRKLSESLAAGKAWPQDSRGDTWEADDDTIWLFNIAMV